MLDNIHFIIDSADCYKGPWHEIHSISHFLSLSLCSLQQVD